MSLIILYFILLAIMLVGVFGALIPAIPGVSLILAAILVWGFVTGFKGMAVSLVVTLLILLLSTGVEILATYWGVKKFGASSWSQIGAVVGLIVGVLGLLPALPIGGPIIGILFGSVIGAFIGEFAYRQELELIPRLTTSCKVCIGIVIGTIAGNIVKTILALVAVIVFVWTTWSTVPDFRTVSFDYNFPKLEWPVFDSKYSIVEQSKHFWEDVVNKLENWKVKESYQKPA